MNNTECHCKPWTHTYNKTHNHMYICSPLNTAFEPMRYKYMNVNFYDQFPS